jgi:hypothetical protein
MKFPQEFVILREVQAVQHFGQNRLEPIRAGEQILAERASAYSRMIETVRKGKQYLVFERDLRERAQPVSRILDEDPAMWADRAAPAEGLEGMNVRQVRAVVRRKDLPSAMTQWFPIGSIDAIPALEKILPADAEKYMVVWEEQAVDPRLAVSGAQSPFQISCSGITRSLS